MDFHPKCTIGAVSLAILVIFTRSFAHGGQVIYEGNSTVDEGEPFTISCFLTIFDPVQWEKDGKPIITEPGITSAYSFHEESVEGKVMASIVIKAALPSHSGSYRCNTLTNESHQIYIVSGTWHPHCCQWVTVAMTTAVLLMVVMFVHLLSCLHLCCSYRVGELMFRSGTSSGRWQGKTAPARSKRIPHARKHINSHQYRIFKPTIIRPT